MNSRYFARAALVSFISFATSSMAFADNRQVYSGWSWGVNVDSLNINSDAAKRPDTQVKNEAVALGFSAEHFSSDTDMTYTIGINLISYKDNNPFTYEHSDGYYESSDAGAVTAYIEAGPKLRIGSDGMTFINVRAGVSNVFASERSVDCDCYSEDINLKGGLYGVVGIGHSFNSFDIAVNFQQYITGDFDNSLSLKVSTTF